MYYHIDKNLYSMYRSDLITELHKIIIDTSSNNFGKITYDILWQTMFFYLEDYALYLSYFEKFGTEKNSDSVIHLGIKCTQNFASFWDYLGYGLSTIFRLDFTDRETYFDPVVNELLKKDIEFSNQLKTMKKLYVAQSELRNRFRHPITHRYHEYFIKRDETDTLSNKIGRINYVLELAYKNSLEAMSIYSDIIISSSPNTMYGSYLKKSIKKQ